MTAVACFDTENNVGAIPLEVDEGFIPCGIEGNQILFERDRIGRTYTIEFYENAPCVVETYDVQTGIGLDTTLKIIKQKLSGTHKVHLSLEGGAGKYWVIVHAAKVD